MEKYKKKLNLRQCMNRSEIDVIVHTQEYCIRRGIYYSIRIDVDGKIWDIIDIPKRSWRR